MKLQYLGALADIPSGSARGYQTTPELSVFAVRVDDKVSVYRNRCPHKGIELNWVPDKFLDRDGEYLQCSSHGALFEIHTGKCIVGPCGGAYLEKLNSCVQDGGLYIEDQGSGD